MTRGAAESRRDAHAKLQLANQQAAGRRFKYLMQQSGLGDFFRDGFFERPVEEPSLRVEPLNVGDKRRKNSVDEKITDEPDTIEFLTKQPSVIQGTMRPYQLAGLNWMIRLRHNGLNGILADEMGLGKTLQSISMLGYLEEYSSIKGPHLVLVPKTTLSGWQNEFARWLPSLKVLKLHATTKDERSALVQEHFSGKRTWDVCLTTYEVATIEVRGSASKTRRRGGGVDASRESTYASRVDGAVTRPRRRDAGQRPQEGALALPHHRRGAPHQERAGAALKNC